MARSHCPRARPWAFPGSLLALGLAASAALGAVPRVSVEPIACLPLGGNAVVRATVQDNAPETEVRVFFRRLSEEVEDFYWLEMQADGGGRYWAVLPRPADRPLAAHGLGRENARAAWWKAKEGSLDRNPTGNLDDEVIRERAAVGRQVTRGWMRERADAALEEWLAEQTNEPAEVYAAVFDGAGNRLSLSPTRVAPVQADCPVALSREEAGYADNLLLGETALWQQDEEPFHWLCDGIVSRRNPFEILRPDGICRACIVE